MPHIEGETLQAADHAGGPAPYATRRGRPV
jgi:hypothetical protein